MKMKYARSVFIASVVLMGMAGNVYLYQMQELAKRDSEKLEKLLLQKQALIKLAQAKPDKPSSLGHRLSLSCNRLSVSEDFQQLSKSLKLAKLDFQISPEETLAETFSESSVELSFQNQSDQPLYHMIAQLMDNFPGLVYPQEIVMWRDPSATKPLISGSFRFQWIKSQVGLKES